MIWQKHALPVVIVLITAGFSCSHAGKTSLSEEEKFNLFLDSLKEAGSTDLQQVNEIRRYLSGKIDLGVSKDKPENMHFQAWEDFSAFQCIEMFENNKLTAKCGLTSYILAKLYDRAGYKSFIYNCGYSNPTITHEFVLVNMDGKLIVQDAFFNFTINDTENKPKDFREILSEVGAGDFSNIRVAQDSVVNESWFNSQAQLDSFVNLDAAFAEYYRAHLKDIQEVDGRIKVPVISNFNLFNSPFFKRMKPRLEKDGYPVHFLSIYMMPLTVKNGNTGMSEDSLRLEIKKITEKRTLFMDNMEEK